MFDWLFEGRLAVYALLLLLGLILVTLWWQRRDRRLLAGVGVMALLALLLAVLDLVIETDREQIQRKLTEMAEAINKKDLDKLFQHVSDSFQSSRFDKKALRRETEDAIDRFGVKDARVSDLDVRLLDRKQKKAMIRFRGSADNNRTGARLAIPCEADFILESDGQWRLKDIRFFRPYVDQDQPWDVFGER